MAVTGIPIPEFTDMSILLLASTVVLFMIISDRKTGKNAARLQGAYSVKTETRPRSLEGQLEAYWYPLTIK